MGQSLKILGNIKSNRSYPVAHVETDYYKIKMERLVEGSPLRKFHVITSAAERE